MKELLKILLFLFCLARLLPAQELRWTYDDRYEDKLLYLHSLANYVLPVNDDYYWEQGQFKGIAVRMSFGSVEINDLLCDYRLQIREELSPGFWFLLTHRYYASQHWDRDERRLDLGFELKIWKGISIYFQGNPAFDKEDADIQFGLSWMHPKMDRYLRMAFYWEDPFYESKNDLDGIVNQHAQGVRWSVRWPIQDCWFYSSGKFTRPFDRSYPNMNKSPEINNHVQQLNHCSSKIYYRFSKESLLEVGMQYYDFYEKKRFNPSGSHYRYQNKIWVRSIRYLTPYIHHQQIRMAIRCVNQEADAGGLKKYTYDRTEILPAFFYRFRYKKLVTEFGYMGSAFDWDYDDEQALFNYSNKAWTEKLKLGFAYQINKRNRLEFSLSHVLTYWGFGGGNLQFSSHF